jgi:hypothetical protein
VAPHDVVQRPRQRVQALLARVHGHHHLQCRRRLPRRPPWRARLYVRVCDRGTGLFLWLATALLYKKIDRPCLYSVRAPHRENSNTS